MTSCCTATAGLLCLLQHLFWQNRLIKDPEIAQIVSKYNLTQDFTSFFIAPWFIWHHRAAADRMKMNAVTHQSEISDVKHRSHWCFGLIWTLSDLSPLTGNTNPHPNNEVVILETSSARWLSWKFFSFHGQLQLWGSVCCNVFVFHQNLILCELTCDIWPYANTSGSKYGNHTRESLMFSFFHSLKCNWWGSRVFLIKFTSQDFPVCKL